MGVELNLSYNNQALFTIYNTIIINFKKEQSLYDYKKIPNQYMYIQKLSTSICK